MNPPLASWEPAGGDPPLGFGVAMFIISPTVAFAVVDALLRSFSWNWVRSRTGTWLCHGLRSLRTAAGMFSLSSGFAKSRVRQTTSVGWCAILRLRSDFLVISRGTSFFW